MRLVRLHYSKLLIFWGSAFSQIILSLIEAKKDRRFKVAVTIRQFVCSYLKTREQGIKILVAYNTISVMVNQ
jgi:hypothetical protein